VTGVIQLDIFEKFLMMIQFWKKKFLMTSYYSKMEQGTSAFSHCSSGLLGLKISIKISRQTHP